MSPTRVLLEVPGDPSPQTLELEDGETLVVGREPTLPGRAVAVAAPSVSANHVTVARTADAVVLIDERSRNGTWLRLPPGAEVRVETSQPLQLRLGATGGGAAVAEAPDDAVFTDGNDFHLGVAAAVTAWFERQRIPARVSALPSAAGSPREGQIPLANGFDLSVLPLRTIDHRWERFAAALWSYVAAQNQVFSTEEHTRNEGMVLVSPVMRRVHRAVVEAARRGVRILLFGPSGAGKDGLARTYHRNSGRAGAFVAKNCSMFSREFLRTELFGAEKGAYTGAVRTIIGAVERAGGGTLFLDEIGDMSADVQAMLLTFLDHGEFERFGGNGQVRKADVRIVSATNRDLRNAIANRTFREDLWYRLAGQVIEVPPLADRPEDVAAFLHLSRIHDVLTPAARERVLAYRWPGNFRELKSFAAHVPQDVAPASLDVDAVDRLLGRVSLSTPPTGSPAVGSPRVDIARLAALAAESFQTDLAHEVASWDDVKQYVESYFKPLLLSSLAGATAARPETVDIPAIAHALDADRGTVRKHLARFFDRFAGLA